MCSTKISMFSCWKGSLLSVNETHSVCERRLRKREKWLLESHKNYQLPSEFESCHAVSVVLNSSIGCQVPFILATHHTTSASQLRTTKYELLVYADVDSESYSLSNYGSFDVPKSKIPSDDHGFALINGPMVIWTEDCSPVLHIVHDVNSAGEMSHDVIDVHKFVKGFSVNLIEKFWVFDWSSDNHYESLLFMRLILDSQTRGTFGSDESVMKWICVSMKSEYACRGSISTQAVQASSFIPCEYGYIATCVISHEQYSVDTSIGDIVVKNQFIVGTSFNQVIIFEDGAILHCVTTCSIPVCILSLEVC